jgi:hypothetical protein
MFLNAQAGTVVASIDHELLWQWAQRSAGTG